MTLGPVTVTSAGSFEKDGSIHVLTDAVTVIPRQLSRTKEKRVRIPRATQHECEWALELAANLVSTAYCIRRRISSPTPCLAFISDSDDEHRWLDDSLGVQYPVGSNRTRFLPSFDLPSAIQHLSDRYDGVSLLAEAFANDHPSGRYHELMRLFELAFKCNGKPLVDPLSAFLEPNKLQYTRAEVVNWIQEVRHGLTHADRKTFFLLEADVRPVIDRVEQAAYDVLLNKGSWRTPSSARRSVWTPTAGLRGNTPFIIRGTGGTMVSELLDDLDKYPRNLDAFLLKLPDGWWNPEVPPKSAA